MPTGRFLKKRSAIWWSICLVNQGDIIRGTSSRTGHMYATRDGAEKSFNKIKNKEDWRIVEG